MGCSASKEAIAVAEKSSAPTPEAAINSAKKERDGVVSTSPTAYQHDAHDLTKSGAGQPVVDSKVSQQADYRPSKQSSEAERRPSATCSQWQVRPGYSSGGSSDLDPSEEAKFEELDEISPVTSESRHSDILTGLKEDFAHEHGLTSKVVRLETPFDTPIELVYDGVHDGPILGEGVSGVVREVVHRATGVHYAMKCLPYNRMTTGYEGLEQLRNEIFIMCQLDLPYIVRIEEVYESSDEMYIVQELCSGGELFDRLEEQSDYHYTEAQCAKLVKQMVAAVRYLHSKAIIHRDLKLENFLFSSRREDSELKMIDFGLSKHFKVGESQCEQVGTPYCVAPEIIKGAYDEKCDVWALGVITYLLLCGETPFGGLDGESLLLVKENIMRAEVVFEPHEAWEGVSDAGKAFVKRLLNPDPAKRPTAKEVQRDEWIQVWAKKSSKDEKRLNPKTINSLMEFKMCSDMKKLLSEVLSFTLMPEQIVDLRSEFEKMDTDGDGEISLHSLKLVLLQNAEAGALGALTEGEVEELFDSLRVDKSETTIRWHEFLAAGLSQAKIDDRNLRLAFDRLDANRKGFLTFDDMAEVLGDDGNLEIIWRVSLEECEASRNRITFMDFKKIIKGQPKVSVSPPASARNLVCGNSPLSPPAQKRLTAGAALLSAAVFEAAACDEGTSRRDLRDGVTLSDIAALVGDQQEGRQGYTRESRSQSHEGGSRFWVGEREPVEENFNRSADFGLPLHSLPPIPSGERLAESSRTSSLLTKSPLYRHHVEMRHAVLEASKRFDQKMRDIQTMSLPRALPRASLIMKRGEMEMKRATNSRRASVASDRESLDAAVKRSGRVARGPRRKTNSDIRGMV